jgi:hypothetical protein
MSGLQEGAGQALTRRGLLRIGAGLAAATTAAGFTAGQAMAAVPEGRFLLDTPSYNLLWKNPLHDVTVLQSLAFDNVNNHIYTAQVQAGSTTARNGDLVITKLNLTGGKLGHMILKGFGHGVSIGVEPVGTTVYLWTETDGASDGENAWGRKLARFRFVNGATRTTASPELTKYAPIAGATSLTCAIDPSTNRLIMRHRMNGQARFAVYLLDDLKAGRTDNKLYDFAEPTAVDLANFQGYTAYGNYVYTLDGHGYSATNPPPGDTYVTSIDMRTGQQVERFLTQAGKSLDLREPEGMAIQLVNGAPKLCFGLASGAAGARRASVFYKETLV